MSVSQDGDKLLKVAEDIRKNGDEFNQVINQIYEDLEKYLGSEYDPNKAWWGPKSEIFLQNARNKRENFERARDNINAMAQNLEEQVNEWNNFEA